MKRENDVPLCVPIHGENSQCSTYACSQGKGRTIYVSVLRQPHSFFNSLNVEEKEGIVREGIHIDTRARHTRHTRRTRTHHSTSEAPSSVTSDPRCSQNIEHGRCRYGRNVDDDGYADICSEGRCPGWSGIAGDRTTEHPPWVQQQLHRPIDIFRLREYHVQCCGWVCLPLLLAQLHI